MLEQDLSENTLSQVDRLVLYIEREEIQRYPIDAESSVGDMKVVEGQNVPRELKYTKDHEWLRIEDDKCRIGITDYAQNSLHEVVYADLPQVGRKLTQKESLGTVESVKAVSEIYSPISGEVVEVNQKLADAPELVNKEPYGEGWLILVRPSKLQEETSSLLSAEDYEKFLTTLSQQK